MVSMAIASVWASIAAWFTPTVLFCATNIIIATIFIASNNNNNNNNNNNSHQDHAHSDHSLTRMSRVSSFLDRARSIKLSSSSNTSTVESQSSQFQYDPSESKTATYSSSSRLAQSIHLSSNYELLPSETETQPLSQLGRSPSFFDRVKSFRISSGAITSTQPETADSDPSHNSDHHVIRSKPAEMKKSRSEMRMASNDDGEDVDLRRPATTRERRSDDVDEEVDAKADDFISRFKQQLKLQRLESLVRYNQMLNRNS